VATRSGSEPRRNGVVASMCGLESRLVDGGDFPFMLLMMESIDTRREDDDFAAEALLLLPLGLFCGCCVEEFILSDPKERDLLCSSMVVHVTRAKSTVYKCTKIINSDEGTFLLSPFP
jgi:hypothetical protein